MAFSLKNLASDSRNICYYMYKKGMKRIACVTAFSKCLIFFKRTENLKGGGYMVLKVLPNVIIKKTRNSRERVQKIFSSALDLLVILIWSCFLH